MAKIVHQDEPGVLVYRITRGSVSEDGSQDIRVIEQYVLHTLTVLLLSNRCVIFVLFSSQFSRERTERGKG